MNELWNPPKTIKEALTCVFQCPVLRSKSRAYLFQVLREKNPVMNVEEVDDIISESVVRLMQSNATAYFNCVFGYKTEQRFAPYWARTAVNVFLDVCDEQTRSHVVAVEHARRHEERLQERSTAVEFVPELLHEPPTEQFSALARTVIDARRWNELVWLHNEHCLWLEFPYTRHPNVPRAANPTTQRADRSRARRVIRELLEADTTLNETQRRVITEFFLNTYERS